MDLSIGEVARLTGLPVKTIRYYSDIGLVAAASRSDAGYRRYDAAGLSRLELIHALRDLGVELASIRRVTERQTEIEEVARAHADAIDLHVHQLTLRRAVLRAIARGVTRPEEVQRVTAFAQASAEESRRIMEEFLDSIFADHQDNPFAQRMRTALPVLSASWLTPGGDFYVADGSTPMQAILELRAASTGSASPPALSASPLGRMARIRPSHRVLPPIRPKRWRSSTR